MRRSLWSQNLPSIWQVIVYVAGEISNQLFFIYLATISKREMLLFMFEISCFATRTYVVPLQFIRLSQFHFFGALVKSNQNCIALVCIRQRNKIDRSFLMRMSQVLCILFKMSQITTKKNISFHFKWLLLLLPLINTCYFYFLKARLCRCRS